MSMTPERAAYFMRRFKKEEKLLGPNEQAAIDFVISKLETMEPDWYLLEAARSSLREHMTIAKELQAKLDAATKQFEQCYPYEDESGIIKMSLGRYMNGMAHLRQSLVEPNTENKDMDKQLEIPVEVADSITLANLTNHYHMLKEQTDAHLDHGTWMHAEDLANNVRLIRALEHLIPYYGGEL